MGEKRVKVSIDDMNFYVVGDSDSNYIRNLAGELDERIKKTQNSNYKLNQTQSLILTALNILDEKQKTIREENSIQEIKEDDSLYRENIKKLEEANLKNDKLEERNLLLEKDLEKINKKLDSEREENQKFTSKIELQNKELEEVKAKLEEVKKEKEILEKQIYDSQKRIIDLNREIESLNDK